MGTGVTPAAAKDESYTGRSRSCDDAPHPLACLPTLVASPQLLVGCCAAGCSSKPGGIVSDLGKISPDLERGVVAVETWVESGTLRGNFSSKEADGTEERSS